MIGPTSVGMDVELCAHASSNGVTRNGRLSPDRFPGLSSKGDFFGKSGRSVQFIGQIRAVNGSGFLRDETTQLI